MLYQPLSLQSLCTAKLDYERHINPRLCPGWVQYTNPQEDCELWVQRCADICAQRRPCRPCPYPQSAGMLYECIGCGYGQARLFNWPVDQASREDVIGTMLSPYDGTDIVREISEIMDDGEMDHTKLLRRTIYRNSEIAGLSIAAWMMGVEMRMILFRCDLAAYMKRLLVNGKEAEHAHERLRSVVWSLMENQNDIATANDLVAAINKGDDGDGPTDPDTGRHFLRACCYPHTDQLVGSILPTFQAWSDARQRFMDACAFKSICAQFMNRMMYAAYASIPSHLEDVMASTERKRKRESR